MYLAKKYANEKYTVLSEAGFLVLQESRPVALKKLREAGIALPEKILDTPPTPATWRAAFVAATAAEAVSTREAVEKAASEEDVAAVKRTQAKLEVAVAELADAMAQRNREDDIQKLRSHLQSEYKRLVAAHGSEPNAEGRQLFWNHLHSTAAGRRLAELEAG